MNEPQNLLGVAHLGYIAYTWRGNNDDFVVANADAGPAPFTFVLDGGDDSVVEGGGPVVTDLFAVWDGNPAPGATYYEVEVYGDAAKTDLLASDIARGTTYRISVPDERLNTTHYCQVRTVYRDERSNWTEAEPTLPFRFAGASKPGAGQVRVSKSDVSPNSLDGTALASTLDVGVGGFTTLRAKGSARELTLTAAGLDLTAGATALVSLPTDGSNASFSGDLIAASLDSYGGVLRNTTTAALGSTVALSAGKYPNPSVAPNARNQYPWRRDLPQAGGWGLFLDTAGGDLGIDRTAWTTAFPDNPDTVNEYYIGSGMGNPTLLRSITIAGSETHSVVRVNTRILVLYALGGSYYIQAYDRATLAKVGTATLVAVNSYEPCLISDLTVTATNANLFFVVDTATATGTPTAFRWRQYEVAPSTGVLTLRGTATSTGTLPRTLGAPSVSSITGTTTANPSSTTTTAYLAVADTAAERVFKWTITRNGTSKYLTSVAYASGANDSAFQAAWGGAPWGWSWDSSTSTFAAISGADAALWESGTSTSDVATYGIQYAWVYSPSNYTTKPSPSTSLTRLPYAWVYVDVPNPSNTAGYAYVPDEGDVYADAGSGGKLQQTVTLTTVQAGGQGTADSYVSAAWSTYNASGAAAPASNTFLAAGGSPAVLKSENGEWAFYGDGTYTGITGVATGAITAYAGATAPSGYLLCQGQTVSRTTYAALFAVCSTTYNTGGELATDFRLPNLQQRFPLGKAASGNRCWRLGVLNVVEPSPLP